MGAACIHSSNRKESKFHRKNIINILLLGKTGNGKSSSGNKILQRKAFYRGTASRYCQLECSEFDDMLVRVVDTPGLMDTRMTNEEIQQRIYNGMSLCPEGFKALVYVISFGVRFTKEEIDTFNLLKQTFGERFIKHCIVIMTKGDIFEMITEDKDKNYTFQNWLNEQTGPPEFLTLLNECEKRIVLFYNEGREYAAKREQCIKEFMQLVSSIPNVYTSDHFPKCVAQRIQLADGLKLPAQIQFIQEQLHLIKQTIQTIMDIINKMSKLVDKKVLEIKNIKAQTKLSELKDKIEKILHDIVQIDNGSGAIKQLLEEARKLLKEVEEIRKLSEKEKSERLKDLELKVT
ncbi:Immune-associated nucleotide-binding protein 6 [Bulinus truncatus]|nr:Immune-associated nucleotide-binding protein 6 [Bulinus truncatus]